MSKQLVRMGIQTN